jgi:GNAT superfamily N-acetyltransferase
MTQAPLVIRTKTSRANDDFEDCEGIGKYVRTVSITASRNASSVGYLTGHILSLDQAQQDMKLRTLMECTDEFEDMIISLFKGKFKLGDSGELRISSFSDSVLSALPDRPQGEPNPPSDQKLGDVFIVQAIKVYEAFRGQGIGSALLAKLSECKKIAPTIYLKASPFRLDTQGQSVDEVAERSNQLQSLYARYGFTKIPGTEKEMVATPELMRRAAKLVTRQPSNFAEGPSLSGQ